MEKGVETGRVGNVKDTRAVIGQRLRGGEGCRVLWRSSATDEDTACGL